MSKLDELAPLRPNVAEVAGRFGTTSRTVALWITRGVRSSRRGGAKAATIRLAATRLPGGWAIREEDLEAFQAQLTEAWLGPTVAATLEPPGQRSRRAERAMDKLARLGLATPKG